MSGKVIGQRFNNGFAGSYARLPEMHIYTKPNTGDASIPFGAPVMQGGIGVKAVDGTLTAETFVGIAARQVQSATDYLNQNGAGEYVKNAAVPVLQAGRINVFVANGSPALYGKVYVRTKAEGTHKVGDFECAPATLSDSSTPATVELTNCKWGGTKDANGVAELCVATGTGA